MLQCVCWSHTLRKTEHLMIRNNVYDTKLTEFLLIWMIQKFPLLTQRRRCGTSGHNSSIRQIQEIPLKCMRKKWKVKMVMEHDVSITNLNCNLIRRCFYQKEKRRRRPCLFCIVSRERAGFPKGGERSRSRAESCGQLVGVHNVENRTRRRSYAICFKKRTLLKKIIVKNTSGNEFRKEKYGVLIYRVNTWDSEKWWANKMRIIDEFIKTIVVLLNIRLPG